MNKKPSILDLRDIVVPDPVSTAPETWGWYVLFALVLVIAAVATWWLVRRRRANRYRRVALAALPDCTDIASLAVLVKRVCLSAYPRAEVASLSGESWLRFLDSTIDGTPFSTGPGRALDHYAQAPEDVSGPAGTVETWIRRHRARD